MQAKIHIIVLNWNGWEDSRECLQSLQSLKDDNFAVTLADNGSDRKIPENFEAEFPDVNFHFMPENTGFAGGNNRAAEALHADSGDYFLFLNNDTIVDANMLAGFRKGVAEWGKDALFGAKIFFADPSDKLWYAGAVADLQQGKIAHLGIRQSDAGFDTLQETGYITGCALLIRAENFQHLGGFDEAFNMYAEDVDLCLRAKKIALSSVFVPGAKLWHKVSASMGGQWSFHKQKRKLASLQKLMKRHLSPAERVLAWPHLLFRMLYSGVWQVIRKIAGGNIG